MLISVKHVVRIFWTFWSKGAKLEQKCNNKESILEETRGHLIPSFSREKNNNTDDLFAKEEVTAKIW